MTYETLSQRLHEIEMSQSYARLRRNRVADLLQLTEPYTDGKVWAAIEAVIRRDLSLARATAHVFDAAWTAQRPLHQDRSERARTLFADVPLTQAEQLPDPNYGL